MLYFMVNNQSLTRKFTALHSNAHAPKQKLINVPIQKKFYQKYIKKQRFRVNIT